MARTQVKIETSLGKTAQSLYEIQKGVKKKFYYSLKKVYQQ